MYKTNDVVCLKPNMGKVYGLSVGKPYYILATAIYPHYQDIYLTNDENETQWYHEMFLEKYNESLITEQGAREYEEIMASIGEEDEWPKTT